MKIDWRVSAIAAGSAFLLSVLVGVIGSVSFGTLVLRAVVAAAIFGAGAIGVTILVDRFLPELRRAPAASADESVGGSVDIVVEGDDDVAAIDEEPYGQHADDSEPRDLSGDDLSGEDAVLEEVEETDEGFSQSMGDAGDVDEISSADDLPSVEPISSGFSDAPLRAGGARDSPVSGEDPELIARAIRTVLKREE